MTFTELKEVMPPMTYTYITIPDPRLVHSLLTWNVQSRFGKFLHGYLPASVI